MCRFVAYVGPPVTLGALLLHPPHALLRQAWAPRHQRHGCINADGFGAGWYDPARRPEPARYRTARPMWADRSFASLADVVDSPAVLAAVRNATPPSPVEESGTPPFTAGPWLFAHNGAVDGFATGARTALRRLLSDGSAAGIEGSADSEVIFALVLDRLAAGAPPDAALADVVAAVAGVASGRLNLVITDGSQVAATAWGDSLFVLDRDGAAVVASEPYDDDPAWRPVPDCSIVTARPGRVDVRPLVA